ncbi:hypothetical protein BSK20_00550 [SR1 bacterium human oral taxon HOT-345]|nr:hypothetical protein BSK20_00550 [SR1 bacterium human oral taxon HOT-345]
MGRIYGKNSLVKWGWLISTGLWALFGIIHTLSLTGDIGIGLAFQGAFIWWLLLVICGIKTLQVFAQKLIIKDDSVVIEKGLLFREQKDIKYKKINSVEIKHFLGFGGIEIQMGNDKPIVFKNLEKYQEVRDLIHQKIDN